MKGPDPSRQRAFWAGRRVEKRRGPGHPVVSAYVASVLDRAFRTVPRAEVATALDVGCGDGRFAYHLGQAGIRTTGIDFSDALVARSLCPDVRIMDAQNLEFAGGSFDMAFEHALLHHLPDPARAVREMARVSRRWVVLAEPNRANPLMFLFHAAVPAERGGLKCSRRFLEGLAREAGLKTAAFATGGMVSANWTPPGLLPLARLLDGDQPWGMTHVLVAEKVG